MAANHHSAHLVAEVLSAYYYSFKFRNFRLVSRKFSDTVTAQYRSSTVMLKGWTESKDSLAMYKKVNQSHYRPEVPRKLQEVKVPRQRDNGPWW